MLCMPVLWHSYLTNKNQALQKSLNSSKWAAARRTAASTWETTYYQYYKKKELPPDSIFFGTKVIQHVVIVLETSFHAHEVCNCQQ